MLLEYLFKTVSSNYFVRKHMILFHQLYKHKILEALTLSICFHCTFFKMYETMDEVTDPQK